MKANRHPASRFPIVAIGASAGGLEAFTDLLSHLPVDTGMAFVLIQHLDPDHPSELANLLARATRMPTREAVDGHAVEPNNVYIIPPKASMTIAHRKLRLEPKPRGGRPLYTIDNFFESLAKDQAQCAIGVVLSGTASDGTIGLAAIKGEGGFTFAQDETAKYDSMPRSAVAAGCVDMILAPAEIANELARFARHPVIREALESAHAVPEEEPHAPATSEPAGPAASQQIDGSQAPARRDARASEAAPVDAQTAPSPESDDALRRILQRLHKHAGVDFSLYKSTTIRRRVARRMVLTKQESYEAYEKFLRNNQVELDALFSDALINVTNFFRDPEAFEALKQIVFPALVRSQHDPVIRVWVLGCSTGQEAYSIAMAFTEFMDGRAQGNSLQIFATDLNETLLESARAGLYAKGLVGALSPERLARFFTEEQGSYRVIKPLRDMVVFARQNLIGDPPFSRLNLISCRNVLIYLDLNVQRRLIPLFHYSLRPDGFLFLGASESIGQFAELFEPVDKRQKIYLRKTVASPVPQVPLNPLRLDRELRKDVTLEQAGDKLHTELSAQREADRVMINEFSPPGVLVDDKLEILQFRGPTAPYLSPPSGKASFDILKMARPKLMLPIRNTINRARRDNVAVRSREIEDPSSGLRGVTVHVIPLTTLNRRHFLVMFESPKHRQQGGAETPPARALKPGAADIAGAEAHVGELLQRLREQERELVEAHDYMSLIQEQADATHEELQASNEEAQSANEELQSINEELQTSKEELESTNEELTTVNEELSGRNFELARVNADLNNLHLSIHTAILVLDRQRSLRRFTPLAEAAFNLLSADIGRPIAGIRHGFVVPQTGPAGVAIERDVRPLDLDEVAREVIGSVQVIEREVRDRDGKWYLLRARPFMTAENKVDGAVLALVDVDALKRSEQRTAHALRLAEATFDAMRDPHLVLGPDLRVKAANDAFYRMFGVDPVDTEGRLIYDLGDRQWDLPQLRTLLEDILPRNSYFNDFEVTHDFPKIGRRAMLLSGRRWSADAGETEVILLSIVDTTDRQRELTERQESEARFSLLAETMPEKIFTARADGEVDYCNRQWLDYSGASLEQIKGWGWTQLIQRDEMAPTLMAWRRSLQTGDPFVAEHRLRNAVGEFRWHMSRAVPLRGPDGAIRQWVCASADIHDVKESDQRKDEFMATLAHELRNPLAPMGTALQILQRSGTGTSGAKAAIDMLQRQFAQAVRLMDDLLDVNRISRGKIGLHPIRMELGAAVEQAVEAVRTHTERHEQELSMELPVEPIYLDADPSRLLQIIGNLLGNASKFTDRGGEIHVSAAREGNEAVIRVRDNGIGIAPDQLRRIFEMFVQVDTSLERTQGGLGIGLTLVKKLVELHGGTIEARSAGIGRGAEFIVRLRAIDAAPATPAKTGAKMPAAAVAPKRILVVDDNFDSAESLSMLLSLSGHDVHVAHDGLEAVRLATHLQPDVILLDIGLPRLNGYDAGRRIRKQRGARPLTMIALTGWGQEADRQRSRDAGFDYHVVKPIDPENLNRIVEGVGDKDRA